MSLILDRRNTALDRRDTNDIIRTAGFTPDISLSARLCFGDNAAVVGGAGHRQAAIAGAARGPYCVAVSSMRTRMITPLDPVIAEIIPLLPLRDPATMTPQSARDALRALPAARAAAPPPPVLIANDTGCQGPPRPLPPPVHLNP